MAEFDSKVILVTGGATGLGAAIAVGAARRGAKALILNCTKSLKEAEATADLVRAAGAQAVIVAQMNGFLSVNCTRSGRHDTCGTARSRPSSGAMRLRPSS